MLAIIFAVMLQQAVPATSGQIEWETPLPVEVAPAIASAEIQPIPDSARADPYGYERAECSPLIRKAPETLEACQARVRVALAAHLGGALPVGLTPAGAMDDCRPEAADDRYAMQCGAQSRRVPPAPDLRDRTCTTRPTVTAEGAVSFREECMVGGETVRDEGLKIRLGGRD